MGQKINFYKKLEVNALQGAYNRLHNYIMRNNEALAEKGEFSILNSTHANLLN